MSPIRIALSSRNLVVEMRVLLTTDSCVAIGMKTDSTATVGGNEAALSVFAAHYSYNGKRKS